MENTDTGKASPLRQVVSLEELGIEGYVGIGNRVSWMDPIDESWY